MISEDEVIITRLFGFKT